MTTLRIKYRVKIAPRKYIVQIADVDLPADRRIAEDYATANLGASSVTSVIDIKTGRDIE